MSGEIAKIGKRAVNRIAVGILFLIIFGITGGVAVFLLGVPLRGDIADLGAGISNIWTAQGFGIVLWWAVSTLIIAGIAISGNMPNMYGRDESKFGTNLQ